MDTHRYFGLQQALDACKAGNILPLDIEMIKHAEDNKWISADTAASALASAGHSSAKAAPPAENAVTVAPRDVFGPPTWREEEALDLGAGGLSDHELGAYLNVDIDHKGAEQGTLQQADGSMGTGLPQNLDPPLGGTGSADPTGVSYGAFNATAGTMEMGQTLLPDMPHDMQDMNGATYGTYVPADWLVGQQLDPSMPLNGMQGPSSAVGADSGALDQVAVPTEMGQQQNPGMHLDGMPGFAPAGVHQGTIYPPAGLYGMHNQQQLPQGLPAAGLTPPTQGGQALNGQTVLAPPTRRKGGRRRAKQYDEHGNVIKKARMPGHTGVVDQHGFYQQLYTDGSMVEAIDRGQPPGWTPVLKMHRQRCAPFECQCPMREEFPVRLAQKQAKRYSRPGANGVTEYTDALFKYPKDGFTKC